MDIAKEIIKLLDKRYQTYQSCMEKYEEVCKEFEKKLIEMLPYEGKIIKIQENSHCVPRYIKVKEVFQHGNKIIIRGYGFYSEFTEYRDSTFADWDFMQSHEFMLNNIGTEIEKIHIINEVEFNRSFDQMINNMRYRHMQEML